MDQTEPVCESCTLRGLPVVPWQCVDNPQYPILFVGQAPGATEALTRVPFTGTAGKMLFRLEKEAGLDKRNLCHTNLVSCPPPDDREPTQVEIDLCHERLKGEILYLQPELIIALGAPALRQLTGSDQRITKARGEFFDLLPEFGYPCKVLACLHPSFVQRQRQWIDHAVMDLKKIKNFFTSGIEVVEEDAPKFLIDPPSWQLSEYLSKDAVTAFDLETTGLNPRKDEIIGVSFCNEPNTAVGVYFSPEKDEKWEVVSNFLQDPRAEKCTQNGLFDLSFLRVAKIPVKSLTFDTHVAQKMLNPDLPADLQFLRQQFTTITAYKPSEKEMKLTRFMDKRRLTEICCWDALTTFMVMRKEKEKLSQKELNLIDTLLLPLVPCLVEMEAKGLLVDVDQLAALYGQMYPMKEKILEEFLPIGLNPGSPVQICKMFNLKDSQEETLKYLIKRNDPNSEWFEKILSYRKYEHSMGTYLKGIYDRLEDGKVHTRFKFGTGTGRLSSEDPNLQNVPEPLRVIYIPDDPDHVFMSSDYRQLELRVLGLVAGVQSLLDSLARGEDPHEKLRAKIFSEGREGLVIPERQRLIAKAALFGTVYGRTKRSIGLEFGVSDYEAESWQNEAVYNYPEIPNYWKDTERQLNTVGYVETPFGRRRYNLDRRQGYNTPIQGTAGDINNTTLLKLYQRGFDVRLTVHDDNVLLVRKEDIEEVSREVRKIAQEPFEQLKGYSFPVKIKAGPNWRDLEEVK